MSAKIYEVSKNMAKVHQSKWKIYNWLKFIPSRNQISRSKPKVLSCQLNISQVIFVGPYVRSLPQVSIHGCIAVFLSRIFFSCFNFNICDIEFQLLTPMGNHKQNCLRITNIAISFDIQYKTAGNSVWKQSKICRLAY